MAMQTISIHFAVGEVVEPRGTDRIAIGADVDLFLGFGDEAVKENAAKLIRAAQILLWGPNVECHCADPICSKVHPVDLPDPIDEAKRAREIDHETARRLEAAERIADLDHDREGDPAFNGAFR